MVHEISRQEVNKLELKTGQYFVLLSKALQALPLGTGASKAKKAIEVEVQGPTYAPQGVSGNPRDGGVPTGDGDKSFGGWTRRELGRRFGVVFDFEIHRQPLVSASASSGAKARSTKSNAARKPKPAAHKPSNPPIHLYLNLLPLSASASAMPVYISLAPPPSTPKAKRVKIQTDDGLLAGLWAGKVTPQAGYASGRLRVGGGREGGLEKVQELGAVLRDELQRARGENKVKGEGEKREANGEKQGGEPGVDESVGAPSGQGGWGWGLNGGVRAKL